MKSNGHGIADLVDLASFDETVPSGSRILVAVSGGADSVAMLLAMQAIAQARSLCLIVAHVNHGLRPESDGEEAFVRGLCHDMGVGCYGVKLKPDKKPSNVSPEQFWRHSRYAYFEKTMLATDSHFLSLGHNADDLAETFLFHLARGTGIDGLCFSFFKQAGELPIIRPLWKSSRSSIELALNNSGQSWMSDASNMDVRYSRNLIRRQVMPALKAINPSVVDAIARFSDHLENVGGASGAGRQEAIKGVGEPYRQLIAVNGVLILNLGSIASSGTKLPYLVRSYVYTAAQTVLESRQTAQAISIIERHGTGLVALTGGKTLVLTQKHGWIYPGHQPSDKMLAEYHTRFFEDMAAHLPDPEGHFVSSPASLAAMDGWFYNIRWTGGEGLILRNRRAGDRVGSKPLAKLMIDYKIPWYLRPFAVVATKEDGEIVAVAGLSRSMNCWINRHRNSPFKLTATKSESAV